MADAAELTNQGDVVRQIKDRATSVTVKMGGTFVLALLLLIFVYLFAVTMPLLKSASVEQKLAYSLSLPGETVHVGVENNQKYVYRYSAQGQLAVFDPFSPSTTLQEITLTVTPSSFYSLPGKHHITAYGQTDGRVVFHQLSSSMNSPSFRPDISAFFPDTSLEEGLPVSALTFGFEQNVLTVAGQVGSHIVIVRHGKRREVLKSTLAAAGVKQFVITPDGSVLFVLRNNTIERYQISDTQVKRTDSVPVDAFTGSEPVSIALLPGASSVIVTSKDGQISQWFQVLKEGTRDLALIRTFNAGGSISALQSEVHRKSLVVLNDKGTLTLWNAASEKTDHFSLPSLAGVTHIGLSASSKTLVSEKNGQWELFAVNNPHPEVSMRSLWQKVWYENYPEPAFVWQSTTADDDVEVKLSVIPMFFGTIKVVLFSMFIAIPLAIGGAIYTAYLMPSGVRKVIKPTIELMEALPTVILGFLAGLWLAPIVEQNLIGVLLLFPLLPLAFLGMGAFWGTMPKAVRKKVGLGGHVFLLLPIITLTGFIAFKCGSFIEHHYLHSDASTFVTLTLGINFDQRNALVVGIAMAFAIVPTIYTIAEDAIYSVPRHLTNGSLALGATHWQTLRNVVLLAASPGIFAAIMMGFGRAVGETMIVLMATGNNPVMNLNVFEGLRSLAANIAIEMPESEVGSSHFRVLFLTAFALFAFTFLFNTIAEIVRQRMREKYSAL